MSIYEAGEIPEGVKVLNLSPVAAGRQELTPETEVVVINRGHEVLIRKFDGRDYPLHPHTVGMLKMPYGAALHFQKHTVVPGTRDVASGSEQSFIGILGIDSDEACKPFTAEECERFGLRFEAIQREEGDDVQVVDVGGAVASGRVQTGRNQSAGRKRVAFSKEGVTAKGEKVGRGEVFVPDNEALDEIHQDEAALSGQQG